GVTWTDRCREALLGLPVATEEGLLEDESPHAIVRRTPMEWHPLMTAGIEVTRELRPLREGEVAHDNLYAAGMVIGGFASRYVLCADGVALATGWHAGCRAAGAAA
ncbi:MAG: FAD-binding protein, partial [Deltaproteobacteria bacterium]|nr:FAD-binding protein [Deltaproteobacteria bacterium]